VFIVCWGPLPQGAFNKQNHVWICRLPLAEAVPHLLPPKTKSCCSFVAAPCQPRGCGFRPEIATSFHPSAARQVQTLFDCMHACHVIALMMHWPFPAEKQVPRASRHFITL
jgi:hypothetical protein